MSRAFVNRFLESHPETQVITLDLAQTPLPHIGAHHLGAFFAPPAAHSPESTAVLKVSDDLVEQVALADVLILGTPMHNLGISSTMKAWIDNIVRMGKTFRYSDEGTVVGLLPQKKVVIVVGCGGTYSEAPMRNFDFASTYLEGIFRFLGMKDISVILVEGLSHGPDVAAKGLAIAIAKAEAVARNGL